jgi:hypothetical protein
MVPYTDFKDGNDGIKKRKMMMLLKVLTPELILKEKIDKFTEFVNLFNL